MAIARFTTAAAPALHKAVDTRRLTVTAALTYPGADRAGDRLNPAGGRYEVHKANPWVGYEHLRWDTSHVGWVHADARDASLNPVVIARLDDDAGNYAVTHKAVKIDGRDETIPFGTSRFDAGNRLSSQMFALVEDDTLPAVSLELTLVKGQYRELGRSPLEPHRPAYEMDAWNCVGLVHCAEPVNPGALTLRKSLTPAVERALRVAELGKVRGEVAHPLLLKALRERYAPALGRSNTVAGNYAPAPVRKAMDDTQMTPAYEPEGEPDGDEGGGTPTNGVTAHYDTAQQLLDLIDQFEQAMEASDSPELVAASGKIIAKLDAIAEEIKGVADKHDAKLQAKRGGKEEPAEEPAAEPDMSVDEKGTLKAMRPCFYKAIKAARVKRFSKSEVAAAPSVVPGDSPEELEAARREADAAARLLAKRKLAFA